MKRVMRLSLVVFFLAALVSGGAMVPGMAKKAEAAGPIELKYGIFAGPESTTTLTVKAALSRVEKMTNGRVKVKVYDSGVLASGPQTLDAVQRGVLDLGASNFMYSSFKRLPFLMIGCFPFIYGNRASYLAAWQEDDTLIKLCNKYLADHYYDNVTIAGTLFSGIWRLGFKDKQPRVPADLKGIKMRGMGLILPFLESYGASVVSIKTGEVYDALQRGIIDATGGINSNWIDWKWGDSINYLLDMPIVPVSLFTVVNKSSISRLSDVDRAILETALKLAHADRTRRTMIDDDLDEAVLPSMMKIYKPTPEEVKLWRGPEGEFINRWLKTVGPIGQKALDIVKKYNNEK